MPVALLSAPWPESPKPWRASAPPPSAHIPRTALPRGRHPRRRRITRSHVRRQGKRGNSVRGVQSPPGTLPAPTTPVLAVNTQNPRTQHARRIYALAPHAGSAVGGRLSGDSPLPSRSDSRPPKDESLTDSPPSLVSLSRPKESPDPTRRVAAEVFATRDGRADVFETILATPSTSTKDPNKSPDANRSTAVVIF